MNFLTSAISSLTGGIPYYFGEEHVPHPNQNPTIWKIFKGTKKEDGSLCTIFSFDCKKDPELIPVAQNASKKLRSMKVPNILQVLDTYENDSNIYIITERVEPIANMVYNEELTNEIILYIIYFIAKGLKFVHIEGSSFMGLIDISNIYLNDQGEPRLGGFELCTNWQSDPKKVIYSHSSRFPFFNELLSPEVSQRGINAITGQRTIQFDSWRFGVLIYKLFHFGSVPNSVQELTALTRDQSIPRNLIPSYKKLLSNSIEARDTVEAFLQKGESSFFNTNLIRLSESLQEFKLNLVTEDEKLNILQNFETIKDDLPKGFLEKKLLPELLTFYNAYPAHSLSILKVLFSFVSSLSSEISSKFLNPIILKSFTLPDRSVRSFLLSSLPSYIDSLSNSEISDKIFVNFVTGFQDSSPLIREKTIKATLLIAPKLSDRQLNNELLRFLAKTQNDEKPEIRTNTTILIGKIAQYLNKSSRSTVLATAFGKGLKDPFIHSRLAALLALDSCIEYFTPQIISNKILTVIAPSLLDKSSRVRNEAQKSFDLFFQKIKEEAAKLPIDEPEEEEEEYSRNVDKVTENVSDINLNFSNTFSRLTSSLAGSLNQEKNLSTPEDSRTTTPALSSVSSFNKPLQAEKPKASVDYNNWGNDDFDEFQTTEDDGWGMDDIEDEPAAKIPSKPTLSKAASNSFVAPKVTSLATEEKKPINRGSIPKKKGLQLKPKSKLKLELDAGDADGWDDGW